MVLSQDEFEKLFAALGERWLIGGELDAKHPTWGSRITTIRSRELIKAINKTKNTTIAPNQPTYWSADVNKTPDILDFFISCRISSQYLDITCKVDLSSDHLPILLDISSKATRIKIIPLLTNKTTDWEQFRELIAEQVKLNEPIKTVSQLDAAAEHFVHVITEAAKTTTKY